MQNFKFLFIVSLIFVVSLSKTYATDVNYDECLCIEKEVSSAEETFTLETESYYPKETNYSFKCNNVESKIYLIGETHETSSALTKRHELEEKACKQMIYLGYENPDFKNLSSTMCGNNLDIPNLFGFENDFAYSLFGITRYIYFYAYIYGDDANRLEIDIRVHKRGFVSDILISKAYQLAWTKLKRPFSNSDTEALAKFIDSLLSKQNQNLNTALMLEEENSIEQKPFWNKNKAFLEVTQSLQFRLGDLAYSKYRYQMYIPNLTSYFAILNNLELNGAVDAQENFFKTNGELFIWRNWYIAKNIADIYCQASQQGNDLWIMIGSDHVDGLKKLLEQFTLNLVEINSYK